MIKTVGKEIFKPLIYISNLFFQTGKIPKFLKIVLIAPIFRANESNLFENYRPISVLTCFSKLLEKLIYSTSDYITMLKNIKYFQSFNLVLEEIDQLNMPFLS